MKNINNNITSFVHVFQYRDVFLICYFILVVRIEKTDVTEIPDSFRLTYT